MELGQNLCCWLQSPCSLHLHILTLKAYLITWVFLQTKASVFPRSASFSSSRQWLFLGLPPIPEISLDPPLSPLACDRSSDLKIETVMGDPSVSCHSACRAAFPHRTSGRRGVPPPGPLLRAILCRILTISSVPVSADSYHPVRLTPNSPTTAATIGAPPTVHPLVHHTLAGFLAVSPRHRPLRPRRVPSFLRATG